eukprot:1334457-Prymnesium_polylepis.1
MPAARRNLTETLLRAQMGELEGVDVSSIEQYAAAATRLSAAAQTDELDFGELDFEEVAAAGQTAMPSVAASGPATTHSSMARRNLAETLLRAQRGELEGLDI